MYDEKDKAYGTPGPCRLSAASPIVATRERPTHPGHFYARKQKEGI